MRDKNELNLAAGSHGRSAPAPFDEGLLAEDLSFTPDLQVGTFRRNLDLAVPDDEHRVGWVAFGANRFAVPIVFTPKCGRSSVPFCVAEARKDSEGASQPSQKRRRALSRCV